MLLMEQRPEVTHGRFPAATKMPLMPAWTYDNTHPTPFSPPAPLAGGLLVPVRALAEAHDSEASTSGRSFEACRGAAVVLTGLGADPAATFAGVFRAGLRGSAQAFVESLAAKLKEGAKNHSQPHQALQKALKDSQAQIEGSPGLTGCAALVSDRSLAFCSLGDNLISLGAAGTGSVAAIDLLSPSTSQRLSKEGVSLGSMMQQARSAFGSLIPLERAGLFLGGSSSDTEVLHGVHQLDDSHHFLVLGAGSLAEAITPREAVELVHESRERATDAGQSASLLAAQCHRKLLLRQKEGDEDDHVTVAVLHFKPPALPFQHSAPVSEAMAASPPSPSKVMTQPPSGLPPLLLSPSGRRVHFLAPVQGSELALLGGSPSLGAAVWSSFAAASEKSHLSESDGSGEIGFPEGSSLLSSGSRLSQPNMSIPEESALPGGHSAMQLPPPLLAPVRKAYPGSGELRITADLLSSPSPSRKAKIGRAASVNSPEGLWPHPPQAELPPLRSSSASAATAQTSGNLFGSKSRGGGEEGRVRGGLPRISSVPSRLAALSLTSSPTASVASSPGAAANSLAFVDADQLSRKGSQGKQLAPWAAKGSSSPKPSLGRKTRGQSAALRILQAGGTANLGSAPAELDRLLVASGGGSSSDLSVGQLPSSGTESIGLTSASGSVSSGRSSSVRRIPVLSDQSLQAEGLSATDDARGNSSLAACADSPNRSTASRMIPVIPQVVEKGFRRSRSAYFWPPGEIDSAAAAGLLSLDLEGRQHSGRVFSSSSLADSAESLTLNAALDS